MKQLSLPISEELSEYCEFFVTSCNEEAYEFLISEYNSENIPFFRIVLSGEKSSGKSRLAKLWCGTGLYINCRSNGLNIKVHSQYERVVIDNFELADEVELLHIINDCMHNHIVILLVTTNTLQCKLADLSSRINSAYHLKIFSPDSEIAMLMIQEMCVMNKIKVHHNAFNYMNKYLKFNSFVDLLSFKMRLQKICENNKMTVDINTLKLAYENYRHWL